MLTTDQVDHFRTFIFTVLRGYLADRADGLRAEADASLRDAYAANGYVAATSPGDVIAFDLHTWHASAGGRDRLAWNAVYLRAPETSGCAGPGS